MKNSTPKRIGIKDIAKMANVSIGTIDRVLNNRGEVSEKTRQKVLDLISSMGYKPNIFAKSLSSKKNYRLEILLPDTNDNPYWELPLAGILKASAEVSVYNFSCQIHTFDFNREDLFLSKANDILKEKPSGFIFAPVFSDASVKITQLCNSYEIPYVFFDTWITNSNPIAYFGQNSEQSGYLAGHLLNNYSQNQDNDVVVLKLISHKGPRYHLDQREKGFLRYFTENDLHTPESFVVDISIQENFELEMDRIFYQNKRNRIFVANSRVFKVADYLNRKNLNNKFLIGYDLLESNISYLKSGLIDFLICQQPSQQGYNSIYALFNLLLHGTKPAQIQYSPIDIVVKENIDFYQNNKY